MLLNPDMILEPAAVEKLAAALDRDDKLGSVAPKIYHWDFAKNEKTRILDSCGIREISALRFAEIGRGERDEGQFDRTAILGPTGAAAMYRLSALEKAAISPQPSSNRGEGVKKEYFDELMFMYEEDCDLAYRLKLAGFGSKLVPDARIYHDRTAKGAGTGNLAVAFNRRTKSRQIRAWGFLHKHIIFLKYWRILNLNERLDVLWFAIRMFVYAFLFEQYLLGQYVKLWNIKDKIYKQPVNSNL